MWNAFDSAPAGILDLAGPALDAYGNMCVAEYEGDRIVKLSPAGQILEVIR